MLLLFSVFLNSVFGGGNKKFLLGVHHIHSCQSRVTGLGKQKWTNLIHENICNLGGEMVCVVKELLLVQHV